MSSNGDYIIIDDDDDGYTYDPGDGDCELLEYDSEGSEPDVVFVRNHPPPSAPPRPGYDRYVGVTNRRTKNCSIELPDIYIQHARLSNGVMVRPGNTLELLDQSAHSSGTMHSGDFIHVKAIIKNLETDDIRYRGHRMRRRKYLGQIFDWKLNELCMILHVEEGDDRCPFVAGLEDVTMDEVLGVRECTLTNALYPVLSFRDSGCCAYPAGMSEAEIRRQIYHGGQLACRVVSILFMDKKDMNTKTTPKPRSGIVRHLYAHETGTSRISTLASSSYVSNVGNSREKSTTVEDDDDDVIIVSARKRRARSQSIEILEPPKNRPLPHPAEKDRYTFGDVFCGFGGATQGATQAGLHVVWGLDMDQPALRAYRLNHRGAHAFLCNVHDFPPPGMTEANLRVDVLHLSPPCCFFSPAHTVAGPNDQANYEAIYTIGPILAKVQPRVATLEQTFGLASHGQHLKNFYMLLNDIGKAGYDVRYKIQDLSKHGLVQRRKRLLIIAARQGTPLPPFPKESHGPEGSGLQPFVYIDKVLQPLEMMGSRALDDEYHQPKPARHPREPTDPHDFLRGCITTGGSESYHYSGLRKWTVRELSLFQSFPYGYKFTGTKTEATKQVGNAFPPVMAEAMYRIIVKTLEAFDQGLIGAEEDISDLEEVLRTKASPTASQSQSQPQPQPQLRPAPSAYFTPACRANFPFRPLRSPETSFTPSERGCTTQKLPSRFEATRSASSTSFLDRRGNGIGPRTNPPVRPGNRMRRFGAMEDDETIELSD
ncbi:hypothetical protein J1614_004572 [Plenodomus biglobosus]|nr:hypothetical protein J1614_004572 [Plenodomus biglobosus]